MKLPGKLTITHPAGGGEDYMEICVKDNVSSITFLELRISPEALMHALTARAFQDCTLELRGLHNLGKKREHKYELVPYVPVWGKKEHAAKQRALAPFEVDGWRGNSLDLGNFHRGNQIDGYRVSFTRFVDNDAPQEPTP
jgi:hypothetical protein